MLFVCCVFLAWFDIWVECQRFFRASVRIFCRSWPGASSSQLHFSSRSKAAQALYSCGDYLFKTNLHARANASFPLRVSSVHIWHRMQSACLGHIPVNNKRERKAFNRRAYPKICLKVLRAHLSRMPSTDFAVAAAVEAAAVGFELMDVFGSSYLPPLEAPTRQC